MKAVNSSQVVGSAGQEAWHGPPPPVELPAVELPGFGFRAMQAAKSPSVSIKHARQPGSNADISASRSSLEADMIAMKVSSSAYEHTA